MRSGRLPTTKNKEDAFTLFCEGISLQKIAQAMGVAQCTVSAWKKRYDWVTRSDNILHAVKDEVDGEFINRKVRRLEYYKYLQNVSKSNVEKNPKIVTPHVGLEASKMEILESGEATERSEVKSVDTFKQILTTEKKKKGEDEYD